MALLRIGLVLMGSIGSLVAIIALLLVLIGENEAQWLMIFCLGGILFSTAAIAEVLIRMSDKSDKS